jgi:hypothetical protein
MIEKAEAVRFVRKMRTMRFYPHSEEPEAREKRAAIGERLRAVARDLGHASAIVDRLLECQKDFPSEAEVVEVARGILALEPEWDAGRASGVEFRVKRGPNGEIIGERVGTKAGA